MEIEIDDKKYKEITEPEVGYIQRPRIMNEFLMMSAMFGGLNSATPKTRQRPNVNLVEEYKLIQQKKSNLSKSDRDWVEHQFNRRYKEVE